MVAVIAVVAVEAVETVVAAVAVVSVVAVVVVVVVVVSGSGSCRRISGTIVGSRRNSSSSGRWRGSGCSSRRSSHRSSW